MIQKPSQNTKLSLESTNKFIKKRAKQAKMNRMTYLIQSNRLIRKI